jgi:hypothetical protein
MGRALFFALALMAAAAFAQRYGFEREPSGPRPSFPTEGEFHFVRVEYTDLPQFHRRYGYVSRGALGNGWWMQDWPDAEDHFTVGVGRLSRIDIGEPRHFRFTDPRLLDHPWAYATQTGWWDLGQDEVDALREYLLRGGFLVVDDFWGPEQWDAFRLTMDRVFPGKPISDIALSDPVMHVLYDIEAKDLTWIPGTRHLRGPGRIAVEVLQETPPAWRALNDDRDRMVVAVNFNTDVGDAWEYADSPIYPEPMTALAYRYGLNYLIYAMTH